MPHDRDGHLINKGDIVHIPCVVKHVDAHTDYCNVTLESVEPMHPSKNKSTFVVNTRQVELKNIHVPTE